MPPLAALASSWGCSKPLAPTVSRLSPMHFTDRQANHTLTLFALLSLLTFVGINDKPNRWFWVSLRLLGCGAALAAVYGYTQDERAGVQHDEHTRLLDASSEIRDGYEWQRYHQQLQYQRQIEQYETTIAQLQAQLQTAEESNFERLEAEKERLALDYHRLLAERDRLTQEQALLEAHHDARQEALELQRQAIDARESELEKSFQEQVELERTRLRAKEDALEQREQSMLQGFEREWAEREAFYAQIADAALQESHSLKQPDYPLGHSHEELLACEAIRCLYEHGIISKNPVVQGLPNGRFALRFKVLPVLIDGKITTPIRSLGEAFKRIERELIKPLRIAVRGCCADPQVEPIDSGLQLTFDVSGTDWEALEQARQAKADTIAEPDPSHLTAFVQANPQICLMGDSGEGKTTLINHLAHLMEVALGGVAELSIVNPKPNEDTDLSKLKYADFETAIFGLLAAATEILSRLDGNTSALLQRREDPHHPLPQFVPTIYFFDEFSELAGVWNKCKPEVMAEVLDQFETMLAPEKRQAMAFIRKRVSPSTFAADLLKFCWRVGRTEKVKLLIAGQNLKAGTIGTTIQDLHQTAIIYLGEAIREGIEHRVSSWQKADLQQEYAQRAQKVAAGKANRFYGLFVPKGSKAYFATLPDAGTLLVHPAAPAVSDTPKTVQMLERLWQQPDDDRTEDDRTRTNTVPGQFDPLDPEITRQLTEAVLQTFDAYQSQTKVIELVWQAGKSGTSKNYRAAKWKFRRILKKHDRKLPGKPWGKDPDDLRHFREIIGG